MVDEPPCNRDPERQLRETGKVSRGLMGVIVGPVTRELAEAMNLVQESLRKLAGDIRGVALRVASSSQALSATSQEMSSSSQEVAGTVDQISKGAETQAEMVENSNRLFKEMAMRVWVSAEVSDRRHQLNIG